MNEILISLFPVFVVILIGYGVKRAKWVEDAFWPGCETFAYYLLLPVLLFTSIATSNITLTQALLPYVGIAAAFTMIAILILLWVQTWSSITIADAVTMIKGSIYANVAYIGIPASLALFGNEGMVHYALLLAFMVPFVNILVVIVLTFSSPDHHVPWNKVLVRVVLHPLVLACLGGIGVNMAGAILPSIILTTLNMLSAAALPVGLIIVGAALDIKSIKVTKYYITITAIIKLVLFPLFCIAVCSYFKLSDISAYILILYASLPAAAATYLLAKKMGGNPPLMAGIIVTETIASAVTIPLSLVIAQHVL